MANTSITNDKRIIVECPNAFGNHVSEDKKKVEILSETLLQKYVFDEDVQCAADKSRPTDFQEVTIDNQVTNQSIHNKYMDLVVIQSKHFVNFIQHEYVDHLIPRPELEPEDKEVLYSLDDPRYKLCYLQPSFILLICLLQIVFHFAGRGVQYHLRYESLNKTEVWRFWTYFLVHDLYKSYNIFTDVVLQLLIGLPMEKVHKFWRVMVIYLAGIIYGSLLQSAWNGDYLTGGRGGIYALLTAHVIDVFLNRKQMKHPKTQLVVVSLLVILDLMWYMNDLHYLDQFLTKGILAHIGGALAGSLVGIHVLRSNMKTNCAEKYVKWSSLILYFFLVGVALFIDLVILI